jgi:hypothetical protein
VDSTIKGFLSSRNLNTQRTESDDRIEELEAKLAKAVEALEQCAEAFELHSSAYPAMVKGYTLDALTNAHATLAALKGEQP